MIYDKKICPDIMSDHIWDFVGHEQILVGQCLMTDSCLQPCCSIYNDQIQGWGFVEDKVLGKLYGYKHV